MRKAFHTLITLLKIAKWAIILVAAGLVGLTLFIGMCYEGGIQ